MTAEAQRIRRRYFIEGIVECVIAAGKVAAAAGVILIIAHFIIKFW